MNLIQKIEKEEIKKIDKKHPKFSSGDTVIVKVKVVEGSRKRLQAYKGVIISFRRKGLNTSFTVRKISYGRGVERIFQLYSPIIDSIEVKNYGIVRRSKLYYLRKLSGKSARIKNKNN